MEMGLEKTNNRACRLPGPSFRTSGHRWPKSELQGVQEPQESWTKFCMCLSTQFFLDKMPIDLVAAFQKEFLTQRKVKVKF